MNANTFFGYGICLGHACCKRVYKDGIVQKQHSTWNAFFNISSELAVLLSSFKRMLFCIRSSEIVF